MRPKKIAWEDFWNRIKLVRSVYKTKVEYVGTIDVDGKTFEGKFIMSRDSFEDNDDQTDYIDSFAKERVALDLEKKINSRFARHHVANI